MSIVEAGKPIVACSPKNDAHRWPRSDDHRTMRPTGRVEYGNNCVQEIVSGTDGAALLNGLRPSGNIRIFGE